MSEATLLRSQRDRLEQLQSEARGLEQSVERTELEVRAATSALTAAQARLASTQTALAAVQRANRRARRQRRSGILVWVLAMAGAAGTSMAAVWAGPTAAAMCGVGGIGLSFVAARWLLRNS